MITKAKVLAAQYRKAKPEHPNHTSTDTKVRAMGKCALKNGTAAVSQLRPLGVRVWWSGALALNFTQTRT